MNSTEALNLSSSAVKLTSACRSASLNGSNWAGCRTDLDNEIVMKFTRVKSF